MKDVCLVAAYTPDQEREDMLRNLTRFLKSRGKDIVLISHTATPKDILEDVKYHFYDEENELLDVRDNYPSFWWFHDTGDMKIWSNDIWYKDADIRTAAVGFQMLPVTRNFFFGMTICKMLGYDVAHYIEYDSVIDSVDFMNENNKLLENNDGLVYWIEDRQHTHGAYCCYNLNSYSFEELKWNRGILLTEFTELLKLPVEGLIESFVVSKMSNGKNILKKDISDLNSVLKSASPTLSGKYEYVPCIILIRDNNIVTFFGKNTLDYPIRVSVLINSGINIDYEIHPNFWKMDDIGDLRDVKKIVIFLNEKKIKDYNFTSQEEIEKHKIRNKIEKYETN
jgi:hypothetical protein